MTDVDYVHGNGAAVGELLKQADPRATLFTGSSKVAEKLALDLRGKVGSAISLLDQSRKRRVGMVSASPKSAAYLSQACMRHLQTKFCQK